MDGYTLSRHYFDWCFENPDKVSPGHTAIYFFAIEHCNRLGWKEKFGFPTQMTMDAVGIKKHQTFIKYFNDLIEWGFIKLIEKSRNQYSANIISVKSAVPKKGKALDKALIKHDECHAENGQSNGQSSGQSTGQSKDSIDKQRTKNKEQLINNISDDEKILEIELDKKTLEAAEMNQYTMVKNKNTDFVKEQFEIFKKERTHDPPLKQESYIKYPATLYSHFLNWIRNKHPKQNDKRQIGNPGKSIVFDKA